VEKILWSRGTQDVTSNVTGSSIFDFEGDGKAEVVYADECFGRVYSGVDGRVIFSRYRSSCTWLEHPIVVDVDGDFRAEMVIPSNTACGPIGVGFNCSLNMDPDGVDSQFPGLVCQTGSDCVSGICDAGLCRCTTSADCCSDKNSVKCEEFGTKCANPPAGTSGSGKTCRANHPHGVQGIRVYEDQADRWVRSRTLWNQYAYAVTHVNEDGTIPKTSEWKKNWTDPSLNNFRQNVPGTIDGKALGDLTAQVSTAFECQGTSTLLRAPVCNRGTAPVGSGIVVGFYLQGQRLCSGTTTGALEVGNCENVSCLWPSISTTPVDISVVPNDDQAVAQCDSSNDKGVVVGVACVPPK
jgi:hypothetical protein